MKNHTQPEDIPPKKGRNLLLPLGSLFLDPNNFRFVDHDDYVKVPDSDIANSKIQERTQRFILGDKAANVSELIASLTQNGWLDVESIHVRKIDENKYLVVEGNRRTATLRYLKHRFENETGQLGALMLQTFDAIPCVEHQETNEVRHLVVMGLHHISGKKRWPAINQARLMRRLRDDHKLNPNDICKSLGMSKREFNLMLRTLAMVETYKNSDYGDQFKSNDFNIFREVLKAPSIRSWIQWNNAEERATNSDRLSRLFSWLSEEPDSYEEDSENNILDGSRVSGEPAITTGAQIRELAKIIDDPEALKRLDETRSLSEAALSSSLLVRTTISDVLKQSNRSIDRLRQLLPRMSLRDVEKTKKLTTKLQTMTQNTQERRPTSQPWQPYTDMPRRHFISLDVETYKGIAGLKLEDLKRINLLVGINNAGKTSVLECLYLLARQADARALLEIIRRRTRLDPETHPRWLVEQLPVPARMSAAFDSRSNNKVEVKLSSIEDPKDIGGDWNTYVGSLAIDASYSDRKQRSTTHFFEGQPLRTYQTGSARWLCPAVFHSPFSLSDPATLIRCYEASVVSKTKDKVLKFIQDHLDPAFNDIDLVATYARFLVDHQNLPESIDLSSFGEGLQRIFQIGLLFAGSQGGIVLIDEFENALHTNVLLSFTRFIQELAIEFDVQVFLTTHSKEAVDAFVLNEFENEDVCTYLLKRKETNVEIRRFDGPSLKRAIEIGNVDLRRL